MEHASIFFAKLSLAMLYWLWLESQEPKDNFMPSYINYIWFLVELLLLFLHHDFSVLALLIFWARSFLCWCRCSSFPMHCRAFSCIPGLYPLHTSSHRLAQLPPPYCDHQNIFKHGQMSPGRQNCSAIAHYTTLLLISSHWLYSW